MYLKSTDEFALDNGCKIGHTSRGTKKDCGYQTFFFFVCLFVSVRAV